MGCAAGVKRKRYLHLEDQSDNVFSGRSQLLRRSPGRSTTQQQSSQSKPPVTPALEFKEKGKIQSHACNKAESMLKKERMKSDGMWIDLKAEVDLAIQRWESTGRWNLGEKKTRVLVSLNDAVNAKNAGLLATAMQSVEKLGSLHNPRLHDMLDILLLQEELEGIWQCLVSAMKDADRFLLRFWLDEADGKGIDVPLEVTDALLALESDVRKCTSQGQTCQGTAQAEYDARVVEAQTQGDRDMLQRLASAADRFGVDPDVASAALDALKNESEAAKQVYTEQWTLDPDLADVVRMSIAELYHQLHKHGVEVPQAGLDRDDLIKLLCALRSLSQLPSFGYEPPVNGIPSPSKSEASQRTATRADTNRKNQHTSAKSTSPFDAQEGPFARDSPRAFEREEALACLGFSSIDSPTEDELRTAYKSAALKWHPDRHHNHSCQKEANRKFQEILKAYQMLSRRS